jgi:hypothetical protein
MIQFYFLSVLCNALAGISLILELETPSPAWENLKEYFLDETFRLVLGVMSLATGFFKLLSSMRGDLPVIGDLFPAIGGLAAGFGLLFEYYRTRTGSETALPSPFELVFVRNRKVLGISCLVVAGLHFLFPTVLFL